MRWTTSTSGRRAVAVGVLAALGWSLAGIGTAGAVTDVDELGWWSRNPLSSAPDGGFAVGAAPDGVTAVAAMRIDLAGGVDTLVLEVQPTADGIALGSLEVCLTPDGWRAAGPGALDDAPLTACAGDAVPFARAGDGWRADVSSLVAGGTGVVSLGVVPTPGSGTVPFEVTFEAPAVRSTGATAAAPEPDPPSGPSPAPAAAPSPAASPRPALAPAPVRLGGTPTPTVPAAAPSPTVPTAEVPPDGAVDDDGASSTIELATSGLLGDAEPGDPRWGEALVLVLIGAGVGAGVYGVSRVSAGRAARGAAAAPA